MPKVNTEEGLPSASLPNALKSVPWAEGWVDREQERDDDNDSRKVIRSERTVVQPTSKIVPGSPYSCREFGGAGKKRTSANFLSDHTHGRPQEAKSVMSEQDIS